MKNGNAAAAAAPEFFIQRENTTSSIHSLYSKSSSSIPSETSNAADAADAAMHTGVGTIIVDIHLLLSLSAKTRNDANAIFDKVKLQSKYAAFDENFSESIPARWEKIIQVSKVMQRVLDIAHFALRELSSHTHGHPAIRQFLLRLLPGFLSVSNAMKVLMMKVADSMVNTCPLPMQCTLFEKDKKFAEAKHAELQSSLKEIAADLESVLQESFHQFHEARENMLDEWDLQEEVEEGDRLSVARGKYSFMYLYTYFYGITHCARLALLLADLPPPRKEFLGNESRVWKEIYGILVPAFEHKNRPIWQRLILISKPVIAVLIGLCWVYVPFLANGLDNEGLGSQSFWVPLTAAIVYTDDSADLTMRSLNRIGGTVIGVFLAFLYAEYIPDFPASLAAWIVIMLFFTQTLYGWKGREYLSLSATIAFLVATYDGIENIIDEGYTDLNSANARAVWIATAGNRLWATLIGSAIALLVGFLIYPQRSRYKIFPAISKFVRDVKENLDTVMRVKNISTTYLDLEHELATTTHLDDELGMLYVPQRVPMTAADRITDLVEMNFNKFRDVAQVATNDPPLWLPSVPRSFTPRLVDAMRRILLGVSLMGSARDTIEFRQDLPLLLSMKLSELLLFVEHSQRVLESISTVCETHKQTRVEVRKLDISSLRVVSGTLHRLLYAIVSSQSYAPNGADTMKDMLIRTPWTPRSVVPLYAFVLGALELCDGTMDLAFALTLVQEENDEELIALTREEAPNFQAQVLSPVDEEGLRVV